MCSYRNDGIMIREGDGGVRGLHVRRRDTLVGELLKHRRQAPLPVAGAEAVEGHQDNRRLS